MKYNPALDGIRALAVLAVILYHVSIPYSSHGILGVDVFFVLSGFLITTLLLREVDEGGIRLGAFYLRRARRLYPALILLVLLSAALGFSGKTPLVNSAIALLYVSEFAAAFHHSIGSLGHTWSLSVEEHYYLIWPLLLPMLVRLPRAQAVRYMLWVYILATGWAIGSGILFSHGFAFRFDTRLSGLLIGSLFAFDPRLRWPVGLLAVAIAVSLLGVPSPSGTPLVLTRTMVEAASGVAVLLAYQDRLPMLGHPVLAWIGRISYGLYLFHPPILALFPQTPRWIPVMTGTLIGTFALATLSYYTVERYFRTKRPAPVSYPETQQSAA